MYDPGLLLREKKKRGGGGGGGGGGGEWEEWKGRVGRKEWGRVGR